MVDWGSHEHYESHLLNISSITGSVWSAVWYHDHPFELTITPIKLLHWPLPFAFPTIYQSWPDKLPWPWVSEDEWSSNDFFNSRFSPNSSTLRMWQGDSRYNTWYNRWTAENPVDLKKGRFWSGSAAKARASRGVWGHAPGKILRYVPLRYKH